MQLGNLYVDIQARGNFGQQLAQTGERAAKLGQAMQAKLGSRIAGIGLELERMGHQGSGTLLKLGTALVQVGKGINTLPTGLKTAERFFQALGRGSKEFQENFYAALGGGDQAKKRFQDFLHSMKVGFVASTGAIAGFTAAASPAIFDTLTGSVRLLAVQIGQAFLPYMLKASAAAQRAANWFRNLSDATKDNIAIGALAVAGLTGTVVVLTEMVLWLHRVKEAAAVARAAMLAMGGAGVVTGIGAVAAAIGFVGYRMQQLATATAEHNQRLSQIGGRGREEVLQEPDVRSVMNEAPQKRQAAIDRQLALLDKKQNDAIKAFQEMEATKNPFGVVKNILFGEKLKLQETIEDTGRRRDALKKLRGELFEGQRIPEGEAGRAKMQELLMSFKGLPQPSFVGGEELGKQIALAGLQPGGSLEARIQQDQLDNLMKAVESLQNIERKIGPPSTP